jgi:hypothetical protein
LLVCKAVELDYFGGLKIEEMAEILQVSNQDRESRFGARKRGCISK